jgi:hypothetical protein
LCRTARELWTRLLTGPSGVFVGSTLDVSLRYKFIGGAEAEKAFYRAEYAVMNRTASSASKVFFTWPLITFSGFYFLTKFSKSLMNIIDALKSFW